MNDELSEIQECMRAMYGAETLGVIGRAAAHTLALCTAAELDSAEAMGRKLVEQLLLRGLCVVADSVNPRPWRVAR